MNVKSKKNIADLDWQTSSVMRWDCGQEVIAYLDWDDRRYYLWFEPTDNFTDWVEECGGELDELMRDLLADIQKIGVQEFCELESVNEFCKQFCGDDEPAFFYEDALVGICGA